MGGVGNERQRMGEEAEHELGDHEPEVERRADGEGAVERGRGMRMAVIVVVMIVRAAVAVRHGPS